MCENMIEDSDEYFTSRVLLFACMQSDEVLDSFEGNTSLVKRMETYIRDYILIYENHLLHYKCKHVRHFNVSTNSAHEGTNFGIKSHGVSVKPSPSMDRAAKALCLQASMKYNDIEAVINSHYMQNKTWSSLPTSQYGVQIAESILKNDMEWIQLYI